MGHQDVAPRLGSPAAAALGHPGVSGTVGRSAGDLREFAAQNFHFLHVRSAEPSAVPLPLHADLAETSDRELRHFDRGAWALIIVLAFPIGPMLYLMYAKGPRRYS